MLYIAYPNSQNMSMNWIRQNNTFYDKIYVSIQKRGMLLWHNGK